MGGRCRQWYLRRLMRDGDTDGCTPLRKSSRSLRLYARSVVLLVAGQIRRAYRAAKADTGGTLSPTHSALGRARCPGYADVVALGRSHTGCEDDGFWSRGSSCCDGRAGLVVSPRTMRLGLASGWLVLAAGGSHATRVETGSASGGSNGCRLGRCGGRARQGRGEVWCCTLTLVEPVSGRLWGRRTVYVRRAGSGDPSLLSSVPGRPKERWRRRLDCAGPKALLAVSGWSHVYVGRLRRQGLWFAWLPSGLGLHQGIKSLTRR
jgi:hypothetical protein